MRDPLARRGRTTTPSTTRWPTSTAGRRPRSPVVRANMIASLDGGSTVDGRSAGLGNAADEQLFAMLRDLADVILVGSGTVRAERYGGIRLDADGGPAGCAGACPDRRRRSPSSPPAGWIRSRRCSPTPTRRRSSSPPKSPRTRVPDGVTKIIAGHDRVNLSVAVLALGVAGYRRMHCEGGPALLGALVADDLLDECCLTIAPMLLGDRSHRRCCRSRCGDPRPLDLAAAHGRRQITCSPGTGGRPVTPMEHDPTDASGGWPCAAG